MSLPHLHYAADRSLRAPSAFRPCDRLVVINSLSPSQPAGTPSSLSLSLSLSHSSCRLLSKSPSPTLALCMRVPSRLPLQKTQRPPVCASCKKRCIQEKGCLGGLLLALTPSPPPPSPPTHPSGEGEGRGPKRCTHCVGIVVQKICNSLLLPGPSVTEQQQVSGGSGGGGRLLHMPGALPVFTSQIFFCL